jgi:Mrp family chromosome partitioning ATPase
MGRMLETLKLGEGRRAPLAISKPVDSTAVQDCVVDWEIGEEVPFVEVGGPGKKVELSAGLLKHPPQAVPQPPHLPVETAPPVVKASAVYYTAAKPTTVAFESWPAPAPTPIVVSPEIIAYHHPEHAASKEYAGLLESMRGGLNADAANVLLLVGLKPQVGTSTVLLNLAVTAARTQKARVIVVDANRQRAALTQRLGYPGSPGLVEVMDGTLALEQAIVKTAIDSLHLLPAGVCANKPLTNHAMTWLIAWLRERYDLIFVDGTTMEDAEIAGPVPHADGIYLVLPHGESASLDKGVAKTISGMGGRLGGLIHTHFAK